MSNNHGPGPRPANPPSGQSWSDGQWEVVKITREHGDPSDYFWVWKCLDGRELREDGSNFNGTGCMIFIGAGISLMAGVGGAVAYLLV